nr:hypothetical protein [Actinomycetales bacterium]
MNTERYLDVLSAQLRYLNVPDHLVGSIRAETAAHLEESGENPVTAFGPPAEYANEAAAAAGFAPPPSVGGTRLTEGTGAGIAATGRTRDAAGGLARRVERNPLLYVFVALTVAFAVVAILRTMRNLGLMVSFATGDPWYTAAIIPTLSLSPLAYWGLAILCFAGMVSAWGLNPAGVAGGPATRRGARRVARAAALVLALVSWALAAWFAVMNLGGHLPATQQVGLPATLLLLGLVVLLGTRRITRMTRDSPVDTTPHGRGVTPESTEWDSLWGSGNR